MRYIAWTPQLEKQERRNNRIAGAAVFGGIALLLSAESIIELILKIIGG